MDKMRVAVLFLALFGALLACFWASLGMGEIPLSFQQVFQVFWDSNAADDQSVTVIEDIRLPRALLGFAVGLALAVAGTISQAVLRNPLAEPGLIGINSGASVAAIFLIVEYENTPLNLLPWVTFAGALATTVAIFLLAWRGGISPIRLILIGIGINALAGAVTGLIAAFGDIPSLQRAMVWLAGSFYDSSWTKINVLYTWLAIPVILSWLMHRELDLLCLDERLSRSLGLRITLMRSIMILLCALISAAAVSAAGLIGFVGLVCPHVARYFVGGRHILIVPVAGLFGAVMVMAADLIGKNIIPPQQFPVGLVTAMIGAPFFMFLLWKRKDV